MTTRVREQPGVRDHPRSGARRPSARRPTSSAFNQPPPPSSIPPPAPVPVVLTRRPHPGRRSPAGPRAHRLPVGGRPKGPPTRWPTMTVPSVVDELGVAETSCPAICSRPDLDHLGQQLGVEPLAGRRRWGRCAHRRRRGSGPRRTSVVKMPPGQSRAPKSSSLHRGRVLGGHLADHGVVVGQPGGRVLRPRLPVVLLARVETRRCHQHHQGTGRGRRPGPPARATALTSASNAGSPMCSQCPSISRSIDLPPAGQHHHHVGMELAEVPRPLGRPLLGRRASTSCTRAPSGRARRGPRTRCCAARRSRRWRRCRCSRRSCSGAGWPAWRTRVARPPSRRTAGHLDRWSGVLGAHHRTVPAASAADGQRWRPP